ncbi:MAG TPA: thiol:disulfide interchange protein DsbA/DsbL [Quisquiliibacterium sp.]|jgi:thiol:disulfide interchange protein DsbA|nr:thiol:disulfide interchange protein DsbA/DsbL [Quisquiliibacterium sp.]HPA89033.1 thiol:disulfide interchange protein DsbA/DsbL [Quisquiliibacterium sp.]HQD81654.1 thiol:disulfide interchange protein DsbA/DsbL [Quisquiliibacterium sp.]HQN11063.1 thiol:disulfide interchange protein DsbA/DsbL [Quisquiliibacterium sp.]
MSHTIDPVTRTLLKAALLSPLAGAGTAFAQAGALQEGSAYRAVKPAQPVAVSGKIEVLEFFWYGCPHCNALEPLLKDWVRRLPSDVVFQKVHVGLGPSWVPHQQLFYTLDAMGKSAELDERVFKAIHVDGQSLSKPEQMAEFVARQGVDRKLFTDTFDSFAVRTKMRKAQQQAEAYRVDGVPAMSVNGKWYTAPSMAGGNAPVLRVLDHLIELERKARK